MTTPVENEQYINRDISWLEFNARVLGEATDKGNALLERLKFIAIFSSNLDEFYMVRVAGVKQQLGEPFKKVYGDSGYVPAELMDRLDTRIRALVDRQYRLLYKEVLPELAQNGISLLAWKDLTQEKRDALRKHFISNWLPILTPIGIDSSHPFPQVPNLGLELLVRLSKENDDRERFAILEVPSLIPRFIEVEVYGHRASFITSEELIANNLDLLFSKCTIFECSAFRITRDMDFSVEDNDAEDLMQSIEKKLLQRRHREPIRIELIAGSRGPLVKWLAKEFRLDEQFWYFVRGPLHLKQFFELVGKARLPELLEPAWPPVMPPEFSEQSVFETISQYGSVLIAPPFHSFNPIIRFLEEAAEDPEVLAIKQTLYRVSGNSPVVRALRRAAENGKQVTVVVELKARFDEGNNIVWARLLEESGAHVVYGVAGLKVHCKALLVVRREDGGIRRYAHLATGNYNDKTAAIYTDMGIMTGDPDLCFDVANLFNVLTGYSSPPASWRKIAASPFDMRRRVSGLIEREIAHSTPERPGRIIAKMNSLSDEKIVRLLHKAADAGVEIDLIVRGICCYKPKPGQENARVTSIVDRYLEHTRLFYFGNGGDPEFYLASADWMYRNLDRRVELLFPVEDERIREICLRLLEFQLADTDKGRHLLGSGVYTRPKLERYTDARSQYNSYRFLKALAEREKRRATGDALKVYTSPERPVPSFGDLSGDDAAEDESGE